MLLKSKHCDTFTLYSANKSRLSVPSGWVSAGRTCQRTRRRSISYWRARWMQSTRESILVRPILVFSSDLIFVYLADLEFPKFPIQSAPRYSARDKIGHRILARIDRVWRITREIRRRRENDMSVNAANIACSVERPKSGSACELENPVTFAPRERRLQVSGHGL